MLVTIVYAPNEARTGPDLDRIGRVEDVPDELGRVYLNEASARVPTDDEIAAYRAAPVTADVVEPVQQAPDTEAPTPTTRSGKK